METAIVTGASSGIGSAIADMLCSKGYNVYGIGRSFAKEKSYNQIECDLLDTDKMVKIITDIREKENIKILVNCAGVGYYGLHEELNVDKIQRMVRTNIELPMVITNLLLRKLKQTKGYIINISSVTADKSNPHGCAYGATKAALSSFSESLFDEARKYGVKVITIQPDMTQTDLYRNADFEASKDIMASLLPEEVACAVEYAISQRDGIVVSLITVKPQLHRIEKKNRGVD